MTDHLKLPMEKHQAITKLYLCDGRACSEDTKKCCWTQKFPPDLTCRHTTNKEHSLAKKLRGLLPTKFDPMGGNDHILVEHFDYEYVNKNGIDKLGTYLKSLTEKKVEDGQEDVKE